MTVVLLYGPLDLEPMAFATSGELEFQVPTARKFIVDPQESGIYHCFSRCVRQAYLCGGVFEHRRGWIEDRLAKLTAHMAVNLYGYSILSNHMHVVVQIMPKQAELWSDEEVAERYLWLCPGDFRRRLRGIEVGSPPTPEEIHDFIHSENRAAKARAHLCSLSWFMAKLKEPIARRANKEDGREGHFWESRFKSVKILDPAALITTMAYVDLNPLRAGLCKLPEEAAHTSIRGRVHQVSPGAGPWNGPRLAEISCLSTRNYLSLVDATARRVTAGKHTLDQDLPEILQRLGVDQQRWCQILTEGVERFNGTALGSKQSLSREAARRGVAWVRCPFGVFTV
jgi:REP element-mobilizing transposase RayT